MSEHSVLPSGDAALFIEPVTRSEAVARAASLAAGTPAADESAELREHRPRPKPSEHMCTCGKVREACVHDEVRALWSGASPASTK